MSQVTVGTQTTIANLYISILGRNPEPAGFGFWCDRLADNGNTPAAAADIARGFAGSPEFIGTYGAQTTTGAMTLMYNNVLNRAPDANGLAFWVAQANTLITRGTSVGDAYALTGAAIITTAGTNSSSDTALIVAKQTAAIASGTGSGGSGATFTLTTNIETVNANNGDVSGVINGAAGSTYQTGDTINNAKNVNVTIAAASGEALGPLVALNNVETASFRALAAAPVNATLFTNVGTVAASGSTSILTVNNGALASTYRVANTVAGSLDGIAVGIRAGDVAGTTSTANFSVSAAGTASTAATGVPPNVIRSTLSTTTTGIENIAIATAGENFITVQGNTTAATDSVLLTITGSGNNNVFIGANGLATTSTVNAATATGDFILAMGNNLSTGDTVIGTAGTSDVLTAFVSGTVATGLAVSGMETFRIIASGSNTPTVAANTAGATLAFTTNPGFTLVRVDAATAGGNATGINQLLNAGGFTSLNFVGNSTTASATAANNFVGVTATGGYTGAADTLTVNLFNGGVALQAGGSYRTGIITTTGVEAYVVNANNQTANTNTATIDGILDNAITSLTVNSVGSVVLTNVGNTANPGTSTGNISAINFAGVTGTNAVSIINIVNNSLAAAALITAGAGGLNATVAAETATDVLTFTGGIGADTLTALTYAGNIVANGGAGIDTFSIGAGGAGAASAALTGGAGGDNFGFNNGAAAVNTISDLGTGAAPNNIEAVQIAQNATVTATVTANLISSNAERNFIYDVAAGSTLTLNLASGVTSAEFGTTVGAVGVRVAANLNTATAITGSQLADTITGSQLADTLIGNDGVDTITSNGGADAITGGGGADVITLGVGSQRVTQNTADSVASSANTLGAAGTLIAAGQTITFGNGVDVITGFTGGIGGDVFVAATRTTPLIGNGVANNALVAGQNYYLSGNLVGNVFTITGDGLGASTMIIQGFAAPGTTLSTNTSAVILVGTNSNTLDLVNIG